MKQIEKHNIIDIVKRQELKEFTREELVRYVENTRKNGVMYYTYNIENTLQDLVNEGSLLVNYISVKVEPLEYSFRMIDYKVGSKSVAIYKLH
jgi:hypothetical protein